MEITCQDLLKYTYLGRLVGRLFKQEFFGADFESRRLWTRFITDVAVAGIFVRRVDASPRVVDGLHRNVGKIHVTKGVAKNIFTFVGTFAVGTFAIRIFRRRLLVIGVMRSIEL